MCCRLELGGLFSTNRQERENIVYVGDYPCSVIDHYTTESTVSDGSESVAQWTHMCERGSLLSRSACLLQMLMLP